MVKKDTDEDFDSEDFEEDEDSEEDEEEKPKKKKGKPKSKDWVIQHSPETFTVVDPVTSEILAQASTPELLSLQLLVIAAQKSSESAKQTE